MSFWDDLRKQAAGVIAQVTPDFIDGGRNYSNTVRRAPAPRLAAPRRSPAVSVRPATPRPTLRMGSVVTPKVSIATAPKQPSLISTPAVKEPTYNKPNVTAPDMSGAELPQFKKPTPLAPPKPAAPPKIQDDWKKAPTIQTRALTIQRGIDRKQPLSQIALNAGLTVDEVKQYTHKYANDYGEESPIEKVGKFAGDVVNAAAGIVRKPVATIMLETDKNKQHAVNDALNSLDQAYKGGAISKAKLQEEVDKLVGDRIGNRTVVTDKGIEVLNDVDASKQALLGGFQQGVDTASVLPAGRAVSAIKDGGTALTKEAIRDIVRTNAKQATVYGGTSTANDVAQGRPVTPESLAVNFGAPLLLGAGAETAGVGANALTSKLRTLPRDIKNTALVRAADGSAPVPLKTKDLVTHEPAIDRSRVEEYKARLQNGGQIEPIYVMPDSQGRLTVEDGKHRLQAYKEAGVQDIPSYVVTPERLKRSLEGGFIKVPGGTADEPFGSTSPRNDAVPSTPSNAIPDQSITPSSESIVSPRAQELRAEAESRGLIPATGQKAELQAEAEARGLVPPKMSPELRNAIDEVIAQHDPELLYQATAKSEQAFNDAGSDIIPRMHVNDIRRYFGHTEDIPNKYKRTTGPEDLDQLAAQAGHSDVGSFIERIQSELAARRDAREATQMLRELRQSKDIIDKAQKLVDGRKAALKAEAEQRGLIKKEPAADRQQALHEEASRRGLTKTPEHKALVSEARDRGLIRSDEPTPIKQVVEDKKARVGEQFAKPRDSFTMTHGKIDDEGGTILSTSPSGNQQKRLHINRETGVAEVIVETKNPDGTWTRNIEKEPAITSPYDDRGIDAVEFNDKVNKAAAKAMEDGSELHFYATKNTGDPRSLSTDVVPFDPEKHIIDGGFVRDAETNAILGNHIKVDDTGISITIGKKQVNMFGVVGDTSKWKNMNKATYTMDRILEAAAPNKEVYAGTRKFIIEHKQKAEGAMRTELKDFREQLMDRRKELMAAKPSGLRKNQYLEDIFFYAERKLAQTEKGKMMSQEQLLASKYPKPTVAKIIAFDKWARSEYDSLLDRTNEVLRRFGHDEVPKRQNYMTHLQEDSLWDKIGIGEDLYRDLSAGIGGETNITNRGVLPGTIAGKTEDFKPTKKYNPFHQTRRGNKSMTDPFKAMDAYGEAAMFNIHMTEAAVRARSFEAVFRTSEEIIQRDMIKQVNEDLRKSLKESMRGSRGDLVVAFQEYANALAGKSNKLDRAFQDNYGSAGRSVLRVSRMLQKIASNSSIVGNANVTIAQALNLPNNIGTNGIRSVVKGVSHLISDYGKDGAPRPGTPAAMSDFLKVRYTDAMSRINQTRMQKANDVVSHALFMTQFERSMTELSWESSYQAALKKGLTGLPAVKEADRITERLIGGRGIADQPDIYRSTVGRTFLQYTLEVNAALKNIKHDMSPAGLVKYAVAVFVMNSAIEQVTGRAPLPDFIGATIDTVGDFGNQDSYKDENVGDKALKAAQRYAGTAASLSPVTSALFNVLPQTSRQAIFGQESNLGRYDGSPAAAATAGKVMEGFVDLISGNAPAAWDKALAVIPYGAQIRKTGQGVGAMNEGFSRDSKGNPTAAIDTSDPLTWVKAALFGKNSIPEVRDYFSKGLSALGEKQTEMFNTIKGTDGLDAAKGYLSDVMTKREANDKSGTDSPAYADAEAKVKLSEGKWVEKDGVVTYADSGDVVRSYYKKMTKQAIEKGDQSDAAYKNFVLAYGLKEEGKGNVAKTGNSSLDQLNKLTNINNHDDVIGQSVDLMKKSGDGYEDIPDWVTNKYLEKNKLDRNDVMYAAKSSFNNDAKTEVIRSDIAGMNHAQVLNYLTNGRVKSIQGTYWAPTGVLRDLRDGGVISKAEYTALSRMSLTKDGQNTSSYAARSAGRGRKAKSISAETLKMANSTLALEKALAKILKAAGQSQNPKKISYKRRT